MSTTQEQPARESEQQPASASEQQQQQQPAQRAPRRRAPRSPRTQPAQPAQQPAALDIAAAVEAEDVSKAQRVYVRIAGPFPQPDGTLAAVDREQRADGTLGEYLLAEIRIGKQDKSESAQRFSVARSQQLKTTLESHGLRVFK